MAEPFDRCLDRVALLAAFPGDTEFLFVGDSQVERGPWDALLPELSIANHGVGQDTAEGVLARLPDALRNPAPTVLLMAGINDLLAGREPERIAATVGEIVASTGRGVIVHSVLPARRKAGARVPELNRLLAARCEGRARFLDLCGRFAEDWLAPDGLHVSAAGYRGWAAALRRICASRNVPSDQTSKV